MAQKRWKKSELHSYKLIRNTLNFPTHSYANCPMNTSSRSLFCHYMMKFRYDTNRNYLALCDTQHTHTHSVYTFCQWLYVKHFMDLGKNVNSMNKLRRAFLCVITLNTHESRSEWICEYKIARKFKFSNDDAPQNEIMEQTIPWDGLTTNVAKNFNWIPFNRMKYANRNYKLLFSRLRIDGQKSNLEEKLILMGISLASSFFETNLNNSCLTRTHVIWKFSTNAISGPDSHKN